MPILGQTVFPVPGFTSFSSSILSCLKMEWRLYVCKLRSVCSIVTQTVIVEAKEKVQPYHKRTIFPSTQQENSRLFSSLVFVWKKVVFRFFCQIRLVWHIYFYWKKNLGKCKKILHVTYNTYQGRRNQVGNRPPSFWTSMYTVTQPPFSPYLVLDHPLISCFRRPCISIKCNF